MYCDLFQDAEWAKSVQLDDKKWNSNGKYTWIILSHRLPKELEITTEKPYCRIRGQGNGA